MTDSPWTEQALIARLTQDNQMLRQMASMALNLADTLAAKMEEIRPDEIGSIRKHIADGRKLLDDDGDEELLNGPGVGRPFGASLGETIAKS